jgi:hypothetical protein
MLTLNDFFFTSPSISVSTSQKSSERKSGEPYRLYAAKQVERLPYLVIEELTTAKAAALETVSTGIKHSGSSTFCQKYNDNEETRLLFNVKKGENRSFRKFTLSS